MTAGRPVHGNEVISKAPDPMPCPPHQRQDMAAATTSEPAPHAADKAAGFTLVELVAVLAIFALVAVMALQALTGGLRVRAALEGADDRAASLNRTLALLRRDLVAGLPAAFLPPAGSAEPALLAVPGTHRLDLSLGGQPRLPDSPEAGLARVIWRLDVTTGVLTRQIWPLLAPAEPGTLGPEVPMLAGVRSLDLRVTDDGTSWRDGHIPSADRAPTQLPKGLEVIIGTDLYGPLRVLVVP